jgi:DNA-binding NtrC family response regulator
MKKKVLLVDDEKEFLEVLSERLEVRGFGVETATSGEEALRRIHESEFDVIILDVMIPGDNGIEILKEIKRSSPFIHVIMLTGHAKIDTAIRGMELGAYDYLIKPIEIESLVEKIKMAYDNKSAQQMRARQDETRPVHRKPDRNRFLTVIYNFFHGFRRDHRSKS